MDDRQRQRFRTLVYMVVEDTARHVGMTPEGAREVATAAADAASEKLSQGAHPTGL